MKMAKLNSVINNNMQNHKKNSLKMSKASNQEIKLPVIDNKHLTILVDFNLQVENALNDKHSTGNIYLGKAADSKIINKIKMLIGIDVSNRKHVLSKDYIRHLYKHSNEVNSNQIFITKEDIKKIPEIIFNPDNIIRGSDTLDASRKNLIPSVRYIKTDSTGIIYLVEAIPKKGNMQIKTMWKEPTKLIHSNKALHHTSETANSSNSTTLNDKIVSNNNENVKLNHGVVNNMQNHKKNSLKMSKASNQEIKLPIVNNMSFEEQIEQVMNNAYPKRDMIVVSQHTPKILQEIGLKNLPITMTQKHLYSITNSTGKYENMNYHDIPIEIINQIPYALEHPLNILKSDTKNDSIVVVTELADKNDNIIVASIKLDGKGTIQDIRFDTNVMTSAYGKSGNYDYFMKDNIDKGNLLYDIDEGVIKTFNDINQQQKKLDVRDRVQFPMRDSSTSTSDTPKNISPINDNIIANNNENVKLPCYQ